MICVAPLPSTIARLGGRPLVAMALVVMAALPARADCSSDFGALMSKRMAQINALNSNSKSHGGKLDPIEGCPRLRNLTAAEGEIVSYMTKNKDWCSLPDDVVSKMTATRDKTASYAAKACTVAVKMKQMQAEQQKQAATQQQEQAIKLPTGPL